MLLWVRISNSLEVRSHCYLSIIMRFNHINVLLTALSIGIYSQAGAVTVISASENLTSDKNYTLTDDTVYNNNASITGSVQLTFDGDNQQHSLIFDGYNAQDIRMVSVGDLKFLNLNVLEVKDAHQTLQIGQSAGNLFKAGKTIECQSIGKIYLHDNFYKQQMSFFHSRAGSDALMVHFNEIGEIRMENNRTGHDAGPGAHTALGGFFVAVDQGDLLIENVGKVILTDNIMDDVAWGGLIYTMEGKAEWRNVDEITISRNRVTNKNDEYRGCLGGGMFASSTLSFTNCGDILFEENVIVNGTGKPMRFPILGAAVAVVDIFGGVLIDKAVFSADRGNITFRGNQIHDNGKIYLDSVFADTVQDFIVRAQDGREVAFYDKLTANVNNIILNGPEGNASPSYAGTIRFSGLYLDDYIVQGDADPNESDADYIERRWGSRYSFLGADTEMHQGTLILEHEAAIGVAPESWDAKKTTQENVEILSRDSNSLTFSKDTTFKLNASLFRVISEGMLMGKDLKVKGTSTVFQTDGTGVFVGDNVDFSHGVSYDFDYTLPLAQSGITIVSQQLVLGGDFMVADNSRSYSNSFWSEDREFLVLKDESQSRGDTDFDGILSTETQSNEVKDPYEYQGDWSMRWDGNDLYAVWTNTGGIEDVDPEVKGTGSLVENSLWVSLSNMKALGEVVSQQLNYQRFLRGSCRHVWASALGDFIHQETNGTTNGYNYQGYGAAVGIDSIGCRNFVGGIAFGYLKGDMNTRRYTATSNLESVMATIYGGYRKTLNATTDFYWVTSLSAVDSSSDLRTMFSNGDRTVGKWHNYEMLLETKATWNYALSSTVTMSPHIGLEYVYGKRESFDETGSINSARHFGSADLQNLRLPIGVAFTKRNDFANGQFLTNTFDVGFLFDLARTNPEATAHALVNDFQWQVNAANPAREAVRVSWNTFYYLNKKWGVFAGYNAEFRRNAINQQANVGVSYSF